MDLRIKNKVAFVTGGSQGIGLGIAKILAAEGAELILASRNQKHLDDAVRTIKQISADSKVDAVALDVTDESRIRNTLAMIGERRPIDILINNAGGPAAGKVLELPLANWDIGYTALVRSVLLLTQLVIPKMKEKRWGRILTVTSTAARELIAGLPVSATFRAGLSALSKALAKEVGPWGILVNNLLPGPTNTERLKELSSTNPTFFNSMRTTTALGRIAEPEEIGRIAAFLCSEANTFITGTDILADGGYTHAL